MPTTAKQRARDKKERAAPRLRSYDWPIVTGSNQDEECRLKRKSDADGSRDRTRGPYHPGEGASDGGETGTGTGGERGTGRGPGRGTGSETGRDTGRETGNGTGRGARSGVRAPPPPPRCNGSLHRVGAGDTIYRLALSYGVTMEAILAANPQISDPDALVAGQLICIPDRAESASEILNALLTAEKIESALYARGIESPALAGLPPEQFAYFQAGLSHELAHIDVLTGLGASVPYEEFFYPPGTFEDLEVFVNTLLTLETAGVSAYIQASAEFARMGRLDLSRLMDQIMGVEAEHRALLREVLGLVPAADLCFERAPNVPVTRILSALPDFLAPGRFDGRSEGPVPLPTPEQAEELIGPYGCPNPRPDL